ncbi:cubilin [Trichonephila clavipes]|nr:cubilin [Trichonephila clavipes]
MPPNTLHVHTDLHAEIVEVEIEVVSPSIVPSETFAELNRTVTCMVLKANDRHTSCPYHNEFRGPRSDYVRQCNNRIVMAQRKHLNDFLCGRIIGRLECGRTQLEVSEEFGIAQCVISRLCQRFLDDGNVSRCYSRGCSRVTTPNEDQYLAVTAKRN